MYIIKWHTYTSVVLDFGAFVCIKLHSCNGPVLFFFFPSLSSCSVEDAVPILEASVRTKVIKQKN